MFFSHGNYFTKPSSKLEEWNKFPQNEIDKAINQFRTRLRSFVQLQKLDPIAIDLPNLNAMFHKHCITLIL